MLGERPAQEVAQVLLHNSRRPTDEDVVAAIVTCAQRNGQLTFRGIALLLGVSGALVRELLQDPGLQAQVEEVDAQVAQHLQDCIEQSCRQGEANRARQSRVYVELSKEGLRRARALGLPPPEDLNGELPLPKEATQALPGTLEKIQVMARRYEARTQLFHPGDGARPRVGLPGGQAGQVEACLPPKAETTDEVRRRRPEATWPRAYPRGTQRA